MRRRPVLLAGLLCAGAIIVLSVSAAGGSPLRAHAAYEQQCADPYPATPDAANPLLLTDGTVIDVQELPVSDGHHAAVLLIYKYDVAGVSYECSQDVTYLRQWINLHSCRLGLPTSVKYDPHNPGNSLVVSESWMGLRQ